jgi:diaminopimelate epimerase
LKLKFTKMHGAGNDFIVLDATRAPLAISDAQYRLIADRRFGVGADQILIVGRPRAQDPPDTDFSYRIVNSDGGEVEQCGNGARAFVRYVHDHGLSQKRSLRVATLSGIIVPRLEDDGSITVDMGAPLLEPAQVPFDSSGLQVTQVGRARLWPLEIEGERYPAVVLSMGNPHAVLRVDDVERIAVDRLGPALEHDARFAQRVNVGFMQVLGRDQIRLRVWERGTGETLACGTGACAAVVAGILAGELTSPVRVLARGGQLRISWDGPGQSVFMNGPAVLAFEGEIDLDALSAAPSSSLPQLSNTR